MFEERRNHEIRRYTAPSRRIAIHEPIRVGLPVCEFDPQILPYSLSQINRKQPGVTLMFALEMRVGGKRFGIAPDRFGNEFLHLRHAEIVFLGLLIVAAKRADILEADMR